MRFFLKLFFSFFLVFFVAFLFECFFNQFSVTIFYNLIENIFFAITLICPLFFISNERLNKIFFIASYTIFTISLYFETVYYYLFNTYFSTSAVFVALDSNAEESREFMNFYVDTPIIVLAIVLLVFTILTYIMLKNIHFNFYKNSKTIKIKILILFFGILVFLKLAVLIDYNLPFLIFRSTVEYYTESNKFEDYAKNKTGNFKNVSRGLEVEEKEVYIIVIGESTSRKHFGLYDNYNRNTTPLLNEIKDELLVYNDVVSPHTYTIACLTKVLTLGNYENPNGKFEGSIIQLLNQADFKTYWISNQKPVGIHDTQITKIALGADKTFFLNIKHTDEDTTFDGVLLNRLDAVLKEEGNKKVVFLHMLGTHMDYKKRYPDSFIHFKDSPETIFKREEVYTKINAFDNAVRYNDYVVSNVIGLTEKQDATSFVMYFSDHGEEVFDEIDFMGHSVDQVVTKNVYEIPMILWLSDKYKSKRQVYNNLDKPYMSDDLFHGIADLLSIKSDEVKYTRSIFNENFKERKRIIKDSIDYDILFN